MSANGSGRSPIILERTTCGLRRTTPNVVHPRTPSERGKKHSISGCASRGHREKVSHVGRQSSGSRHKQEGPLSYSDLLLRRGTCPSAKGIPMGNGAVMQKLVAVLDFVFGCHHGHLSRVFTIDGRTYRVCCGCGAAFEYSLESMRMTRRFRTFALQPMAT